jgi:flagellar biosynthesis/type III secretory pathway protein FliH
MSWSKGPSRVLKGKTSFSTFRFEDFDLQVDTPPAKKEKPGPDRFENLSDSPETRPEFVSITDHPDMVEKMASVPAGAGTQVMAGAGDTSEPLGSEALEVIRKTEEEMAALKEETCRNCTLLEQQAYEKGFAKGETAGIKAGEKKIQALAAQVTDLMNMLAGLRSDLVARYEKELMDLVFAICRKIIFCEISADSRVIKETVLQILQEAPGRQPITLRLHPEDLDAIETLKTQAGVSATDLNRVALFADTSVSRGGCLLETPHGDMDAAIETRLKNVYAALKTTSPAE